jgi:hypothetical protein
MIKRIPMVSAAFLFVFLFGVLFFVGQVYSSTQIGVQYILVTPSSAQPTPAPSTGDVLYVEIEQAQIERELPFTVRYPSYLPDGATLTRVRKVHYPEGNLGVELLYANASSQSFSILQTQPAITTNIIVDQNLVIQYADIGGHQAVLYKTNYQNSSSENQYNDNILQWTDTQIWFEMSGSISADQLIQVAQSLFAPK